MARPIRPTAEVSELTTHAETSGRWDPLGELEQLNRRLAGYLDLWRGGASLVNGLFTPPVDVEETDDAYLVDIELPGVRKQDLNIEIDRRRGRSQISFSCGRIRTRSIRFRCIHEPI